MWYVVVEHEVYVCHSREDAERVYENAEAEYRDPFMTPSEWLARLIQEGNIADDYLRKGAIF
jgi:hypothetical protein